MTVRELESRPGTATLYPKAIAGSTVLPVLRKLPLVGGRFGGGAKRELPDLELLLRDIAIDRDHLAAYDRVCGFRLADTLPATYPHMVAFPLSMELMTDSSFPFGVIGLVHVENRIELARPIAATERLDMRVRADKLRPHRRGTQFDVLAEASSGGETVWRSASTYLHRGGSSSSSSDGERPKKEPAEREPHPASAEWELPGDLGRRYAAVSGDSNPIHMHPLTAKAFGMKTTIAHGMWTKARCLAALEGTLPDAYTVSVRFKAPLFIPGRAEFADWDEDGVRGFEVRNPKSGKPHLEGRVEPA
jgi:hypothetical protein